MRKKVTALIAALFMLFAVFGCAPNREDYPPCEPETPMPDHIETLREFMGDFPEASRDVVVISNANMTRSEFIMVTSLQGLVAKVRPAIFIDITFYMPHLQFIVDNYEGFSYIRVDCPWELVMMFRDYITDDGYVLFEHSTASMNHTVNAAATISGLEGWLMIASEDIGMAMALELTQKADATGYTTIGAMSDLFEINRHRLNRRHVLHQNSTRVEMRDLSIALGAFAFFTPESPEGRAFRRRVFEWMEPNRPVWGWTLEEIDFVHDMSLYGNFVWPADWSSNISFLAGVREGGPFVQPYTDRHITGEQGKHYIALVVSDGDNIQWAARDFMNNPNTFFGNRITRHNSDNSPEFRMSWTFPPVLGEIKEPVLRHIYSRTHPERDSFVAGVSGIGYGNPMTFPRQYLPLFADSAARHMEFTGISVITMLDDLSRMQINAGAAGVSLHDFASDRLYYFARHDAIAGGVWQMDPGRYESGQGRVFWSNGKPFISIRLSMWHPSNNMALVDNDWLRGYAERINDFARDHTIIDGFTVVNIHPWTVNLGHLDYFVSQLADHIVILTAGELICMVTRYVPQAYRNPGNEGIRL